MKKKYWIGIAVILAVSGVVTGYLSPALAESLGVCPPGYARVVSLEPIQPGERVSKATDLGCQPHRSVELITLEPMSPEDIERYKEAPSYEDQGEAVNGFVRGPSVESSCRCVFLLEPIQPGETFSNISGFECGKGSISKINNVSLESQYLIAKFYNRPEHKSLLVEYYGASPCSPNISYGVSVLPDNLAKKFASGKGFSNCDLIHTYNFNNFGGPSYSCGANCPSFYSLNNESRSWKVID
ncbi:MAG: hypothetical protein R6U57_12990 [Anaerolineales bacterium]